MTTAITEAERCYLPLLRASTLGSSRSSSVGSANRDKPFAGERSNFGSTRTFPTRIAAVTHPKYQSAWNSRGMSMAVPHLAPHASAPQRLPRHNRGKRELDAFRFAENGEYVQTKFNLSSLKEVHARDLIAIDDSEIRRSGPVILPRKECIIVSISHVKAIILSDQLLLLDAHRPLVRAFAEFLRAHLKSTFPLRNQFRHTWSQGGGGAGFGLVGLHDESPSANSSGAYDPTIPGLNNVNGNMGFINTNLGASNLSAPGSVDPISKANSYPDKNPASDVEMRRQAYNDFMNYDLESEYDASPLASDSGTLSGSAKERTTRMQDFGSTYQGASVSAQEDVLPPSSSPVPNQMADTSTPITGASPPLHSDPAVLNTPLSPNAGFEGPSNFISSASAYSLTPAAAAVATSASAPTAGGGVYPDALSTGTTAFEFRVLEGILRAVSDKYDRRLRCYAPVISTLLQELTAGTSVGSAIPRLLPLKNSLHSFERAADEILAVLTGLIHSNEDMLELFITEKKRRHGQLPPVEAHQECELLLETFHREFSQIRLEAQHLRKKIMATEDLVRITMDAYRNRMIMVQAYMAMLSTGLSTGALVASIFGMNLHTGLEQSPVAFYAVASTTVILASSVYILVYRQFLHQPRLKHIAVSGRLGTGEELALLKAGMDDLGDIQDMLLQLTQNKDQISRAEFRRFVREASGRACPEHTLNLIFKLYGVRPRGGTVEDEYVPQDRMYQFLCDYPSARWTGRSPI